MASQLYEACLRLLECCRMRVKDVDFARREIVVREGKGRKDRTTILPSAVVERLISHLERMRLQHHQDLGAGAGNVELPDAIARKYPRAPWEWRWQWVFPAKRFYVDPETGRRRRHHLHETVLQKAVREAVRRVGISKPATMPHASALLRDTPSRGRVRHPDDSGASRTLGRRDDDDVHARP
jgi:integrase